MSMSTNASASRRPSHVPTHDSDLRKNVIQVLSATANGCLSELGYLPGMPLRLQQVELSNVQLTEQNRKLYEDNVALAKQVASLTERLKFVEAPEANKVHQMMVMSDRNRMLVAEKDELIKRNEATIAGCSKEGGYQYLASELLRTGNANRALLHEVSVLKAECERLKAITQDGGSPTAQKKSPTADLSQSVPEQQRKLSINQGVVTYNQQLVNNGSSQPRQNIPGLPQNVSGSNPSFGSMISGYSVSQPTLRPSRSSSFPGTSSASTIDLYSPYPRNLLASRPNFPVPLNQAPVSMQISPNSLPLALSPSALPLSIASHTRHPSINPALHESATSGVPSSMASPQSPLDSTGDHMGGSTLPLASTSSRNLAPPMMTSESAKPTAPSRLSSPTPTQLLSTTDHSAPSDSATLSSRTSPSLPQNTLPPTTLDAPAMNESVTPSTLLANPTSALPPPSKIPESPSTPATCFGDDRQSPSEAMEAKTPISEPSAGEVSVVAALFSDTESQLAKRSSTEIGDAEDNEMCKKPRWEVDEVKKENDNVIGEGHGYVLRTGEASEDDDEESDDEIMEVDANGLRTREHCVALMMDDDGGDKQICKACNSRYKAGLTRAPPQPFTRASLDELVQHCEVEHPAAWDCLRNPRGGAAK